MANTTRYEDAIVGFDVLKVSRFYTLVFNPEFNHADENSFSYALVNKNTGSIEYKSVVYPMALEALINLESGIDTGEKEYRERSERTENKVVSIGGKIQH